VNKQEGKQQIDLCSATPPYTSLPFQRYECLHYPVPPQAGQWVCEAAWRIGQVALLSRLRRERNVVLSAAINQLIIPAQKGLASGEKAAPLLYFNRDLFLA